jgi:hypothetical protein
MADPRLRTRVERLLRGDVRVDDLMMLFLFVRDRNDGREAVQEIGDFVAHQSDRTKGIVTREVRDWYRITSFMFPRRVAGAKKLDRKHLPTEFPAFLQAALRRASLISMRDHAGLRRADAAQLLPSILRKLERNKDGTLALTTDHTKTELQLIEFLCGHLHARPAFDGKRLLDEFSATLKSNALLRKEEVTSFGSLQTAIALFAAACMQNCTIQLGDGKTSWLGVCLTDSIDVYAATPFDLAKGHAYAASSIFSTGVAPLEHCVFELLSDTRGVLKMDLELKTPEILLSPLH